MIPQELLRARRLALGAILAGGDVPKPGLFVRAGLPPLFRASEWMAAEAAHRADLAAVGVSPDQRITPDGLRWARAQRERSKALPF